jgi:hypothetical protein
MRRSDDGRVFAFFLHQNGGRAYTRQSETKGTTMKFSTAILCLLFVCNAVAQVSVTAVSPTDLSVNVPLHTTVSITYNVALDTTAALDGKTGILSNISPLTTRSFSADCKTVSFPVDLQAGKEYFVVVYYGKALAGGKFQTPMAFRFTTGPSFSGVNVTGNVHSGLSGVSPAYAPVILSSTPIQSGGPTPIVGAVADGTGAFNIPHVPPGVYFPLSAYDVTGEGDIDPSGGDVIAYCDSIIVATSNYSGVSLTFIAPAPLTYAAAVDSSASASAGLPSDKILRLVSGDMVDSAGTAQSWEFRYTCGGSPGGYRVRLQSFMREIQPMDPSELYWVVQAREFVNPGQAVSPATVMTNVENAGGRAFRRLQLGDSLTFDSYATAGDLRYTQFGSMVSDPSKNYWGVSYSFGRDVNHNWITRYMKNFLVDFSTGAVLTITGVDQAPESGIPERFDLSQNFPNPFNPTTEFTFSLPTASRVNIAVYNVLGQQVATIVDGMMGAGTQRMRFDASALSSGVYIYTMHATGGTSSFVSSKKMLVVK